MWGSVFTFGGLKRIWNIYLYNLRNMNIFLGPPFYDILWNIFCFLISDISNEVIILIFLILYSEALNATQLMERDEE